MAGFREFEISPAAMEQAGALGITGIELARLARWSAPVTHAWGNRRNGGYVLRVEAGVVEGVHTLVTVVSSHRTEEQRLLDKERVIQAIAKHFPDSK